MVSNHKQFHTRWHGSIGKVGKERKQNKIVLYSKDISFLLVMNTQYIPNYTNQQPPQCDNAVPDLVWIRSKCVQSKSREFQLPQALPHTNHFFSFCLLNDRRKAARSFFKIGRLSVLFSYLSLGRLHLLIFS